MFPKVSPEMYESIMILTSFIGYFLLISWIHLSLTNDKISYKEKIINITVSMGLIAIGEFSSSFKFFQFVFKSYQYGFLGNLFHLV